MFLGVLCFMKDPSHSQEESNSQRGSWDVVERC